MTKFRRRALLASVAMMLVAMLALGTATFAWFSTNPTANSTGIKMSTTTSTGLLAKAASDTSGFSHNTGLNGKDATATFSVQPVSFIFGAAITNYYTATATLDGNYAALPATITEGSFDQSTTVAGDALTAGATNSNNIYQERIYLKTNNGATGTVTSVNVTMTVTDNALAHAARVTLLKNDGTVIGTWGRTTTAHAAVANNYIAAGHASFTTGDTKYTLTASGTALTGQSIAVSGSETANFVTVLVWLDGMDAEVYTSQATNAAELLSSISIDFSL